MIAATKQAMKTKNYLKISALLTLAFAFGFSPLRNATAADEGYSFKVHNTTEDKITKLLASEDGKSYGYFDIGKGIKADETITLKWDKKTNESGCKWYFKAVFADGEESEAKKFDFCEEDLELEF
jgi:hypothetical protein